jgi:hypothetical protein
MPFALVLALLAAQASDRMGWTQDAFPGPPEGGQKWLCPVLGVATAGALLTPGAQWSAIGFMLWAGAEGCL